MNDSNGEDEEDDDGVAVSGPVFPKTSNARDALQVLCDCIPISQNGEDIQQNLNALAVVIYWYVTTRLMQSKIWPYFQWINEDVSPSDWVQIGITLGIKHVRYKKLANFVKKKDVYASTVYFIDQNTMQRGNPMEMNMKGLEMQNWNIPMDRAQKVDDKNRVICLVTLFSPGVMVIKISEMAHSLYLLLMKTKSQSQFGEIICVHLKDIIEFFQKMVWLIVTGHEISREEI